MVTGTRELPASPLGPRESAQGWSRFSSPLAAPPNSVAVLAAHVVFTSHARSPASPRPAGSTVPYVGSAAAIADDRANNAQEGRDAGRCRPCALSQVRGSDRIPLTRKAGATRSPSCGRARSRDADVVRLKDSAIPLG